MSKAFILSHIQVGKGLMHTFLCIDLPVEFVCQYLYIVLSVEFLPARIYAFDSSLLYNIEKGGG